ncbi:MAG: signal peptide peptidase SppA [Bryobacteraceae bacterium]|nr:signal peptide peptidase SppA [Solibacteraceae bacterium]MCO5350839.1 signal peptide peptidase SppA [Bryobacteraceae bacterium]
MKRFLLGVLAGVVIAGVSVVVLFFASLKLADRTPSVPDRFVLVVRLQGAMPEVSSTSLPFPGLEGQMPLTVVELYRVLRNAAQDSRVAGVFLVPAGAQAGWGKMQELREGIAAVRAAKKPVYAWLQSPGMRDYCLAAGADKVFAGQEDLIDVKGLSLEATYFKGSLDKLGVRVEIEHAGRYKDAGDTFTRTGMSPETRESLDALLDGIYGRILSAVAEGRGKSVEEVRSIVDQGPFVAPRAQEAGLLDGLMYEREARESLAEAAGVGKDAVVTARRYLGALPRGKGKRVAVLVAQGDILRVSSGGFLAEEQAITPRAMGRMIRAIREDNSISGVILRVDSPGGDAVASDEILSELKALSSKKPLVISMSDVAASGGYYIAMTGDPVLAYPDTVTGSIGVIYGKVNIQGLYDKLGISTEILKRGANADIDSAVKPLTPDSRRKLREGVEFIYDGFLKRVAEGRKRPVEEIAPVAEGRVWLGADARERGLVDDLGGLTLAVDKIREKAGLGSDEAVRLVVFPERKSLFQQLMQKDEDTVESAPFSAGRALLKEAGPGIAPWLAGGMLKSMPFRLEIR